MDFSNEKLSIAERVIRRASSSLYSLEEFLSGQNGGTDGCYSRSRYILLSYGVELLLKSVLVLNSNTHSSKDIGQLLRSKGHNLENIYSGSEKIFLEVGIKNVKSSQNSDFSEYVIELVSGDEVTVQDFTDVRYDFMENKLRKIDNSEVDTIKKNIESLLSVVKSIDKKITDYSRDHS